MAKNWIKNGRAAKKLDQNTKRGDLINRLKFFYVHFSQFPLKKDKKPNFCPAGSRNTGSRNLDAGFRTGFFFPKFLRDGSGAG